MRKFLLAIFVVLVVAAIAQVVMAEAPVGPGGGTGTAIKPNVFVSRFFSFGLAIGGILAFGAISWGAFKYIVAAGNPSAQGDAKDWILQALLGLLLLAGSLLILRTINPSLVGGLEVVLPEVSQGEDTNSCSENCALRGPDYSCGVGGRCERCTLPCDQDRGQYCKFVNGVPTCQGGTDTCGPDKPGRCPTGKRCFFLANQKPPYFCDIDKGRP